MKKLMISFLFAAATCLVIAACGSQKSGQPVTIPVITMACTAGSCLTPNAMFTEMFITSYSCSESSLDFSVAASSSEGVTCNSATGCSQTFSDWIDSKGDATTTVPSNTYNLCGIVASTSFAGPWAGHVVAVGQYVGAKIDGKTTAVSVTNWANGASF